MKKRWPLKIQGLSAFSVVNHISDQTGMSRLHRLRRLISASQKRFIVDFVRQQSDYYYDLTEEGSNMKVPINQKYMLTIAEASEYFGIGEKVLMYFALSPGTHFKNSSLLIG